MTATAAPPWEHLRTAESRQVEDVLRRHFAGADAYRYNSASLRVLITDPRFREMDDEARHRAVSRALAELPEPTRGDIINLVAVYPGEWRDSLKWGLLWANFVDPKPSSL